jgi:hypothetical protein
MPRRGPAGTPGVKLTLSIDSTAYDVEPLANGTIRLEKQGGGRYLVNRGPDGVTCDCPDFTHRAKSEGRLCKHASALDHYGLPILQLPTTRLIEAPPCFTNEPFEAISHAEIVEDPIVGLVPDLQADRPAGGERR